MIDEGHDRETKNDKKSRQAGAILARFESGRRRLHLAQFRHRLSADIEAGRGCGAANSLPQAIIIPHESAAMAMAHGYYLATGRAQAVMAHTMSGSPTVQSARSMPPRHVPIILFSGRNAVDGIRAAGSRTCRSAGARNARPTALVARGLQMDYEAAASPEQALEIIDRAHAIACRRRRGRCICRCRARFVRDVPGRRARSRKHQQPVISAPPALVVQQACAHVAQAKNPVSSRSAGAGSAADLPARQTASAGGSRVQYWAIQLAIATDHPMAVGHRSKNMA